MKNTKLFTIATLIFCLFAALRPAASPFDDIFNAARSRHVSNDPRACRKEASSQEAAVSDYRYMFLKAHQRGYDFNKKVQTRTFLMYACEVSHLDFIEAFLQFLEKHGDVDFDWSSKDQIEQGYLHFACQMHQEERATFPVRSDVHPQHMSRAQFDARVCAIVTKMLKLIVRKHESDMVDYVNDTDGYGRTPLQWTAFYGYKRAAQVLIEHGADINHVATDEQAMSLAEFVRGFDRSAPDVRGFTALTTAVYQHHYDMIEVLAPGEDIQEVIEHQAENIWENNPSWKIDAGRVQLILDKRAGQAIFSVEVSEQELIERLNAASRFEAEH